MTSLGLWGRCPAFQHQSGYQNASPLIRLVKPCHPLHLRYVLPPPHSNHPPLVLLQQADSADPVLFLREQAVPNHFPTPLDERAGALVRSH
jgi:hypothetical protein